MAEEKFNRSISIDHLIGKEQKSLNNFKHNKRFSKVIKAKDVDIDNEKKLLLSLNEDGQEQDLTPAILIEKKDDRIYKIIVDCPCGRHAALQCEYDDEQLKQDIHTAIKQIETNA